MLKNKKCDIGTQIATEPDSKDHWVTVREDSDSNDIVWFRPSHLRPSDEFAVGVQDLMDAIQIATERKFYE